MTFLETCQRTYRELGIGQTPPSTVVDASGEWLLVVQWVREANREVVMLNMDDNDATWRFMWDRGSFLAQYTGSGYAKDYDLSGVTPRIFSVRRDSWTAFKTSDGESKEYKVQFIPYRDYQRSFSFGSARTTTGTPTVVTQLPDGTYRFYPTPASQYTFRFDYLKAPASLTADADELNIPQDYEQILVYRAQWSYADYMQDSFLRQTAMQKYGEVLRQMLWNELTEEDQLVVRPE